MSSQVSENIIKLFVFFFLVYVAKSQTSEPDTLCDINTCPNDERCLRRDGPGNLTFVCECVQTRARDGTMGHNCFKNNDPVHSTFLGCYGKACERGSFSSPNYPQDYETRDKTFMALYIPHAKSIFFDFSSPFCIEEGKDELYVGSGLEIYFGDIDDLDNLPENWYHFDGSGVPSNFTLQGTDTTFVYFSSDKSTVCEGFNITWEAQGKTRCLLPNTLSNFGSTFGRVE
ncbi:putative hyalin [Apostichopus japonicus]|uniref:Putative hyalin n=1 Tax=Stichopus japonicus TaxID=307972 RepID=A0A2G8K6H5_STIJA|nr:putative hyalin [Apostichopus japonicus]